MSDTPDATSPNPLDRNLKALARTQPALAQRLRDTEPAPLAWWQSKQGPLTASVPHRGRDLALASKYDPRAEAEKLVGDVDLTKHAGVVLLGMGVGHHAQLIATRLHESSLLVVYEPDAAVLRAVLEKVDHTAWLGTRNVVLADPEVNRATLLKEIEKYAGNITQGCVLVTHPPTRQRFGDELQAFAKVITDLLAYFRTNVATALVNSARTCDNLLANLPYYAAGAPIDDLENAAKGKMAVCVAAGPSLARNIDLLKDPAVRERVVVITVQTTLQPLLKHGIKPDFVTALDYSEISKRFYENLPPLPDVTLVAETKAHPAILDAFPGPKRVTWAKFLGFACAGIPQPESRIREGSTVAHLSFYLAQFLGCDPICFLGQDLGFSDGLYYFPGLAMHDVWAPELSPFNTLEMLEWQRIARHRNHLSKQTDIHGRGIYSDEQMMTYLKQFERDFAGAEQTILDCTEGGMPKDHTTRMTFREAIEQYTGEPVGDLPIPDAALDPQRLADATALADRRVSELDELCRVTRATVPLLRDMQKHQDDKRKMDQLFNRLNRNQAKVHGELAPVFHMVSHLNTVGHFKRSRADRRIHNAGLDNMGKQAQQLDRDIENLEWLLQAAEELRRMLVKAAERCRSFKPDTPKPQVKPLTPEAHDATSATQAA